MKSISRSHDYMLLIYRVNNFLKFIKKIIELLIQYYFYNIELHNKLKTHYVVITTLPQHKY